MHFYNPELAKIRNRILRDEDISRYTRILGLSTAGALVAPFGHVHEICHRSLHLLPMTQQLVADGRLELKGPTIDSLSFIDNRKELYSSRREDFPNYFLPSYNRILSEAYSPSPDLETSSHIKQVISSAANGVHGSNLISAGEVSRIANNKDFLRNEFLGSNFAATYGSYLGSPITPQPDESFFLGEISTRLFGARYRSVHAAMAPTGIYNDSMLEDEESFPHFDLRINFSILKILGLEAFVSSPELLRQFRQLACSPGIVDFVAIKNELISSCTVEKGLAFNDRGAILEELRQFNFRNVASGLNLDPLVHAERISEAMTQRRRQDRSYARRLNDDQEKKLSRRRIGIFSATPDEAAALATELVARGFVPLGTAFAGKVAYNFYGYYDTISVYHVQTAAGGSGVHGSQNVATEFLANSETELLISMGICFGVDPSNQKFGDIVVAERFSMYEPGKVMPDSFEFRGDKVPSEQSLASFARARRGVETAFGIHVGPMLSGDKVVDDIEFRKSICTFDPKAKGGEMEGHGLVTACQTAGVQLAMAKAICDYGDGKDDTAHTLAAQNSASFVVGFILSMSANK